jgi:hypothetical protein
MRCGSRNVTRLDGARIPYAARAGRDVIDSPELRLLFHRLNNQLGVVLAHAELLESKVTDAPSRARASQVVASALEAMGTVRDLREFLAFPPSKPQ